MKVHIQYVYRDDSLVGEHASLAGSNTCEVTIPSWSRSNIIKACFKLALWDDKSDLKEALDEDSEEYFYTELDLGESNRNNAIFADSYFVANFNVVQVD
jgi:hypothetical protein